MPDDADRALIVRILAGGPDARVAFRELYDRYQKQVFTLCYRLMGDAHRAADATQESFLAVLRGLGGFGFQSSFKTWLFQVTKNAALQQLRKTSSRSFLSLEDLGERREDAGEWLEIADRRNPGQLDLVIEGEFARDLQKALNRLKRQHTEILSLRYFGGLSYEAMAEVLACSIGTIKSRLNRAHKALRPYLVELMRKHRRSVSGMLPGEGEPGNESKPL